jgi:quercetin dioxygenase-like cupin family protein
MQRRRMFVLVVLCLTPIALAQNTPPLEGKGVEIRGVTRAPTLEKILSGHLTDLNGKYKFRAVEVTYQPGAFVGDHQHAGPGIRYILAGEFTYIEGDKTTVYKAGDTFFEPGDMTHRAYNRGNTILKVWNVEIVPADYTGSSIIAPPH